MNDDSTETRNLLEQALRGDRRAFERLFARHRDFVRTIVQLRLDQQLKSRLDASDVVQETQLEAFRRLDDYLQRRPMPFRLWLRKTTLERLIKLREQHLHAQRRTVQREAAFPEKSSLRLARQLVASAVTPSQDLARRELVDQVRRALTELSDTNREILVMRYVEKLSNQEIGYVLEMDAGAVSKRHGRALLKMQRVLAKLGIRGSQL